MAISWSQNIGEQVLIGLVVKPQKTRHRKIVPTIVAHKRPLSLLYLLITQSMIQSNSPGMLKRQSAQLNDGALVTFVVAPEHVETSYGYIQAKSDGISKTSRFEKKPDAETAQRYLTSGDCYWNSDIFVFRAQAYLDALQTYAPDVLKACTKAFANASEDLDFLRVDEAAFTACESISVDYAVMEKTDNAIVVPFTAGWSDIGSWDAVHDISEKDERGSASGLASNTGVTTIYLNRATTCRCPQNHPDKFCNQFSGSLHRFHLQRCDKT